ncbi:MAG TPA: peroxiredoxin [Steroidobacteraceae bacterium]|nr:peroxiredoxin [Steroidobacteraceae bacterium]
MTVAVGKKVPDFTVPVTGGKTWSLRETLREGKGEKLVIYFYPKDMTAGCTRESQDFRDHYAAFRKAKVRVVGISRDSIASHEKFRAKEALPFELLSDADEKVCRLFDVIKEKTLYGRKYMGVDRSTFLIDADGILRREWRGVKVPGHVEEVLEAAKSL